MHPSIHWILGFQQHPRCWQEWVRRLCKKWQEWLQHLWWLFWLTVNFPFSYEKIIITCISSFKFSCGMSFNKRGFANTSITNQHQLEFKSWFLRSLFVSISSRLEENLSKQINKRFLLQGLETSGKFLRNLIIKLGAKLDF